MTLSRLVLKDFQPHGTFVVDLDPGVNVIVGDTDQGKSSILRGLRWLCLNRPDGDSVIRHGQDDASVLAVVDGRKVRRRKGKGGNSYSLGGKRYVSFGRGKVPDDVSKILNVGDINFSLQLPNPAHPNSDPAFWFALPAPAVSRELNAIIDLGTIDAALSAAAAQVRSAQAAESVCQERLNQAKTRRDELAWAIQADSKLQVIEGLRMAAAENHRKAILGSDLLAGVARASSVVNGAANAVQAALEVVSMGEKAAATRQKAEAIQANVDKLSSVGQDADLELPTDGELNRVERLLRKSKDAKDRAGRLGVLLNAVREAEMERDEAEREHEKLVTRYNEQVSGKRCPICNNPMKGIIR